MLALILSVLGIGGVGAAAFVFPAFGALLFPALRGLWAFIRKVPWQVWAVLAAAILVWRVYDYHVDTVAAAYSSGDKAGYSRAMGEVRVKAEEIRRKAEAARRKAEAAAVDINREVQDAREKAVASDRARAAALRVHGPGRAAESRAGGSSANLPGVPGSAVATPGGAAIDAQMARVPWLPLVDFAEEYGVCHNNNKAWESWYDRQKAAHDKWQPPPE